MDYLNSRLNKLNYLSVKEISKFNLIIEDFSLKILDLIKDKKFEKEEIQKLAAILNTESFLKIFVKAMYIKLKNSNEKICENFTLLFYSLFDVKFILSD
jgi:hypothetical protein